MFLFEIRNSALKKMYKGIRGSRKVNLPAPVLVSSLWENFQMCNQNSSEGRLEVFGNDVRKCLSNLFIYRLEIKIPLPALGKTALDNFTVI